VNSAGAFTQSDDAVAIGYTAGRTGQGQYATALGSSAAYTTQGPSAVAIGYGAGNSNQQTGAIAIGMNSGSVTQGNSAIAIGAYSGTSSQNPNSIILNATGSALQSGNNSALYVAPIRQNLIGNVDNTIQYNVTTKEVTYVAPLIIQMPLAVRNSCFHINQRAIVSRTTTGIFADGWTMGTPVNPYVTVSQEAITDLVGFNTCAKVVTSAASATIIHLYSPTEGTYTQEFKFGYSNCVGATVSMWVKSSIASHKLCVSILINGWEVPSSITCSATTNTWTRVSCYIPPSPTGIYAPTGNVASIYVCVNPSCPAGTTYGGTNQVWKDTLGFTVRASGLSDGTTNMMNVSGTQTFRFTGIQMDIGNTAMPPCNLNYLDELLYCQRYFWRQIFTAPYAGIMVAIQYNTTISFGIIDMPVIMRVPPSFLLTYVGSYNLIGPLGNPTVSSFAVWDQQSFTHGSFIINTSTNTTPVTQLFCQGNGYMEWTADL
jgi:hypothetical protein